MTSGQWSAGQFIGRRWPIGCVALEITQRCNLDCTACYLSEHSEAVKDVPIEEVFRPGDFETQNNRYREIARVAGVELARRALQSARLAPGGIDLIVSVSCTGFMIPALDIRRPPPAWMLCWCGSLARLRQNSW